MSFVKAIAFLHAGLAALAVPVTGQANVVVSGFTVSVAGTNGNPALSTPTVAINGSGTFTTGPIVGPNGNAARSSVTVDLANPLPSLSLFATGGDPLGSTAAFGFATATLAYNFRVNGPVGATLAVPVIFAGNTSGQVLLTGNPTQFFSFAGTNVDLFASRINDTFHDVGSVGTAPVVIALGNSPDAVRLGWGSNAAAPVPYVDYDDSYVYEASLAANSVGTVTMNGRIQGGVQGLVRSAGIATFGTAQAFVDPLIFIDPAFLAAHPGYGIEVDAGIGNGGSVVAAVPEPSTLAAMAIGSLSLLLLRTRRAGGGVDRVSDDARPTSFTVGGSGRRPSLRDRARHAMRRAAHEVVASIGASTSPAPAQVPR